MQSVQYEDNGVLKLIEETFEGKTEDDVFDKMKARLSELEDKHKVINVHRQTISKKRDPFIVSNTSKNRAKRERRKERGK